MGNKRQNQGFNSGPSSSFHDITSPKEKTQPTHHRTVGRLWGFTVRNSPSAGSTLSGSIALSESVHLSELGFLIHTMEEVRVHIEPEPEAQRASKSQNESWIQALRVLKSPSSFLYTAISLTKCRSGLLSHSTLGCVAQKQQNVFLQFSINVLADLVSEERACFLVYRWLSSSQIFLSPTAESRSFFLFFSISETQVYWLAVCNSGRKTYRSLYIHIEGCKSFTRALIQLMRAPPRYLITS